MVVSQLAKNLFNFMDPKYSSPYSQKPAIWPYPEPVQSSPQFHMQDPF
jgi:hypothetical protein